MLGMPNPTPYDLNFRLLEIPVRVSPWFWLGMIMVGPHEPRQALLFIPCAFLSILLHEFGHGLSAKAFGYRPEIALFALGGLCASEAERQTPLQRFLILLAGPGIQFVFLALIMLAGGLLYGINWQGNLYLAQQYLGFEPAGPGLNNLRSSLGGRPVPAQIYSYLFLINWLWPLLNLLPIWPLDGGQMTHVLLSKLNRRHGARWTHIIGMASAGLLAFYVLSRIKGQEGEGGYLTVLFFAWFALMNYQMLQIHHQRYLEYGDDDESDWWRR